MRPLKTMNKPVWEATVTTWEADKGCGWLDWAGKRVFLRRRDYAGPRRGPRVGERVRFMLGQDDAGRPCALQATPVHFRLGLQWLVWGALLVLPVLALERYRVYAPYVLGVMLLVSLITYAVYRADKRRAAVKAWRIPETTLHLLEACGGWPGAWLAQRHLRHKCSKTSYQVVFWSIVLSYQVISADSLLGWPLWQAFLRELHGVQP